MFTDYFNNLICKNQYICVNIQQISYIREIC